MRNKKSSALPVPVTDVVVPETALDQTRDAKTPVPAAAVNVVTRILNKAQSLQQPAVAKYVAGMRKKYPDDSPEQIINRLEKRYLTAVTATGGAVGATAAIPGVGTFTALTAITADTAAFIEASALLALATAEVYGISPHDTERRQALVLTVALGDEGIAALGKVAGVRGSEALGKLAVPGLEAVSLSRLNKALTNKVIKKFALRKAPVIAGKVILAVSAP